MILKLSGDYARRVLILILRSLNKIQKKGIIHGNITPETLYISKKGYFYYINRL